MRKLFLPAVLFLVGYLSFIGVAAASSEVTVSNDSLADLAWPIYNAISGGAYWPAAMFALIFLVTALNKYGEKIPFVGAGLAKFLSGSYGKPVTVLLLAFAGSVVSALAAPEVTMSIAVAWGALKFATMAAGGYELLKKLLVPVILKIGSKAPNWMKPGFDLLLWMFNKNSAAVAKAEAAGEAAVIANPAPGAPKSDVTEI